MLALSYNDLYDLTPRSFLNKLDGFNDYQEKLMQDRWEQTRLIIHACISPHTKKRLKPKDLLPFDWDSKKNKNTKIASKEEIEKIIAEYEKEDAKKLN
mgnify:FL=1